MYPSHQHKTYNLQDRFVTIPPFLKLRENKLKYLDALVYAALKSFNSQYADISWFRPNRLHEEGCFPSYDTICKQSGLSRATVVASIKRLEAAKFITVTRSNKLKVVNHYWFPDLDQSYTIPFKLFRSDDLSPNEKAMLICLRQFYIGDGLNCMFTEVIAEIAKHLGVTYRTVHCQYIKLVEKGYVIDKTELYKDQYERRVIKLTDKLCWVFKAVSNEIPTNDFFYFDDEGKMCIKLSFSKSDISQARSYT
jgi:DNA-binding MarR family transcriptional regulator